MDYKTSKVFIVNYRSVEYKVKATWFSHIPNRPFVEFYDETGIVASFPEDCVVIAEPAVTN